MEVIQVLNVKLSEMKKLDKGKEVPLVFPFSESLKFYYCVYLSHFSPSSVPATYRGVNHPFRLTETIPNTER